MPVYLVADIDVHDPETYDRYSAAAQATFAGYGEVKYLVRGGPATVLEGDWTPKRFFVIRFEDREKAMAWYNSPAYREAMKLREASSMSNLFMIDGVDWVVPGSVGGPPPHDRPRNALPPVSPLEPKDLHRALLRIRRFEERAAELYRDSEIPGFLHLSVGQEAVAVGVCSVLRPSDGVVSTHRGHGHCLAKGVDMTAIFAELMGREGGTGHGRGGSMHIADLKAGVYGANGIVGAGLPIAGGVAEGFRQRGTDDVVAVFFGEGAVAQGAFHEALNVAALWKLPVLFVCENNGFAEFSPLELQQPLAPHQRASAYGLTAQVVDGNDVEAVRAAAAAAVGELRAGRGPAFLEARTYRWRGHYEGDPERYRTPEEVARAREGDPLQRFHADARLEEEVAAEVEAAVVAAREQAHPPADEATRFTLRDWSEPAWDALDAAEEIKYLDAVGAALAAELGSDPRVWIAGVDVGRGGGVFGITRGLAERFPGRVLDTPISETAIMGLAVGGAMAGTRPVVELMYVDFLGVCFDQVLNQAAKLHFMTGGGAELSLVIRTQCGAGRASGPQHSQSLEGLLGQVPGLKVVMPSTADDAYGLLRAAIHDPNPVVFIEHRLLYGRRGPRPRPEHRVPLGKAALRRSGSRATVVSWSRMLHTALEAADGLDVDVIDLRTVAPIDHDTIAESVRKTHRLLIAHEAVITSGIGAELAAWAAGELFYDLDAPVRRVAPPFSPVPYAPALEQAWLPDAARIRRALEELILS